MGLQERREERVWGGVGRRRAAGQHRAGRGRGRAPTSEHGEEGAAEAVAHGVGAQAYVHARVVRPRARHQQLVEVGAVRPGPHVARGQHHELLAAHVDGGVVAALGAVLHALQPLHHGLHVAAHSALEGGGAPEVHGGVHGVRAREHGLGARPLCGDTACGRGPGARQPPPPARHSRITSTL